MSAPSSSINSSGACAPREENNSFSGWDLHCSSPPQYSLCAQVKADPFNTRHLFISVTLIFPNRKPVKTYAFIDSGATDCFISETFVRRHSLPSCVKTSPVPVLAADGRPLVSGLVTRDVNTQLQIHDHIENICLGIVTTPYAIILGLDWLVHHNPNINWSLGKLTFSCCNSNSTVSSMRTGHRQSSIDPTVYSVSSATSLGLGLRLNSAMVASLCTRGMAKPTNNIHQNSINKTFPRGSDLGHCQPECSSRPLNISIVSPQRFLKYAKHSTVSAIWYNPNIPTNSSHFASLSTMPISPQSEIPMDESPKSFTEAEYKVYNSIPPKYRSFFDIFSPTEVEELPPHRSHDIAIELEDGKTPPFGPLYSLSQNERAELFDYIEKNLKKGFIRRSTSPAASPILFVRKKNGQLRLCVDYRALNAITKKNRYPLPLIQDLLDRVQGCTVFTLIDLKNAFNLIRIRDGDEWKTAFRTQLGLFEYTVMPFGLSNAPATFQGYVQDVLRDLLDIICVVYIDDILIFSRNQSEHNDHVRLVLERLRTGRLFANIEKCAFDQPEVEYLGFFINAQGIKMSPKKLSTILDWPVPTTIKGLQSFLGFANFYRRFIPGFSRIAYPLYSLTKKTATPHNSTFPLSGDALQAFQTLKSHFVSAPLLLHFDPSKQCTLVTDASDFAISAILLQPDSANLLHPVAYFSRKLSPAEINYTIYDKELLAVIEAFRDMRAWLIGTSTPVIVCCDHKNIQYFMTERFLNRRQARWSMFLSEFNFTLDFLPGSTNPADGPSRRPDYIPSSDDEAVQQQRKTLLNPSQTYRLFNEALPTNTSSIASLSTFSFESSELADKFKDAFKTDIEWREGISSENTSFTVENDLVFHNGRLFVPTSLRDMVLKTRHDSVIAGHPGRTRTINFVEKDYSWPGLRRFVRRYIQECNTCQKIKDARHKPYGLLQPIEIPDRPWKSISMDFIVKLPQSHGYDSIWVVCDRLTRAAHFVPTLESITSSDLARMFLDRIFRYHGLPDSIISDRGSVFVSKFWKELLRLLDVKVKTSTAYHPQTDGLTERTNQSLETYLRAYCSYQQDDWVDYLALAEFSFNNHINVSTKMTPFFANLGFDPTFEPRITERSTVPAASDLATRLQWIREELQAELREAFDTQAMYYNRRATSAPVYQPGSFVWLLRRNIKTTRPSDKLDYRKIGPFEVLQRYGNAAYRLKLPRSLSRLHPVFNVSLLEPYLGSVENIKTTPVELAENTNFPEISTFLDCRKVGRRYEYLVSWKNQPDTENSWIPLSDLPRTYDEQLERFHRRHIKLPRPNRFDFTQDRTSDPNIHDKDDSHFSSNSVLISDSPSTIHEIDNSIPTNSTLNNNSDSDSSTIWHSRARSPSPVPNRYTHYEPPTQTTLRSGRVSKPPPPRLDPDIHATRPRGARAKEGR